MRLLIASSPPPPPISILPLFSWLLVLWPSSFCDVIFLKKLISENQNQLFWLSGRAPLLPPICGPSLWQGGAFLPFSAFLRDLQISPFLGNESVDPSPGLPDPLVYLEFCKKPLSTMQHSFIQNKTKQPYTATYDHPRWITAAFDKSRLNVNPQNPTKGIT